MTLLQNDLLNEFLEIFIEDFQWMWRRMKDAFMDHPFLRKPSPSLFLTCLDQWHSQLIRQFTNSWPNHRTWTYSTILPNFIDFRTHLQRLLHVNRRRSSLRAPCPVPSWTCICSYFRDKHCHENIRMERLTNIIQVPLCVRCQTITSVVNPPTFPCVSIYVYERTVCLPQ